MITNHDAELIARNDAARLKDSNSKGYISKNLFQYYTMCNTWILMVKAHNPIAAIVLEDYIKSHGVIETIANAQECAANVIRDLEITNPTFSMIISGLDTADALQILRFPKRFTIVSESLGLKTVNEFRSRLKWARNINRRVRKSARHLVCAVKGELAEMLATYHCDFSDIRLTNGVSFNGAKTVYDKIISLERPCYYDCVYYGSDSFPEVTCPNGRPDYNVLSLGSCARLSTVPKSYKIYRTIAVETVEKQSDQQCVRVGIEAALAESVGDHAPIHNQGINGLLAKNRKYATIDLSAASDSLTWWLMWNILPRKVYEDCMFARSAYLLLPDGQVVANPIFCTMGNGFCFALETAVFLAIARAATKTWCLFTNTEWSEDLCYAYGDDIIVITDVFDTVIDWLEQLDFTVNTEKSFANTDRFRESCGFDWYDGDVVTSVYWPRAVISDDITACSHLCALEARLFERGCGITYFEAHNFVSKQVLRNAPSLSVVTLPEFLEYNLNGLCLVSLTAAPMEPIKYRRTWEMANGVVKTYEEDRFYLNLIHTKNAPGVFGDTGVVDNYLYYTFLKNGPMYDDELSKLLGVSTSYHNSSLRMTSGDVVVTKRRIF